MKILKEFGNFLKEYKIIGLAAAFVVGAAATTLIQALVNNVIMPIITFFIPGGNWRTASWQLGSIIIGWGLVLSAIMNFVIIAIIIFLLARPFIKNENPTKKELITSKINNRNKPV